jgi:PAS domain S-box-containing protein
VHDDLPDAPLAPSPLAAPLQPVRLSVLRAYFVGAALAALVAIAELTWLRPAATVDAHPALLAAYALLAAAGLAALRLRPLQAQRAFIPAVLATLAVIATGQLATGWGLGGPGTVFISLICCLASVVAPLRQALVVAAAAALAVLALGLAEASGSVAHGGGARLADQLVLHGSAVLLGVVTGLSISRLLAAQLRQAAVREKRFHDLLSIAASAYWETDARLCLQHVAMRETAAVFVPVAVGLGRPPWDTPNLQLDDEVLDALRAGMESRERLRDVPLRWRRASGEWQHFLISGEPRSDRHGRFNGYWGVARDVTAEHLADQARQATEQRYRQMFRHLPVPLVLQRQGRVQDANAAAAQLFGYDSAEAMLGRDLLVDLMDAAQAESALALATELAVMASGQALAPVDMTLTTRRGESLFVKAAGVRTEADDAQLGLWLYVDETARRAAVSALQRSQALLSTVISMSPDVITLTELASGRYQMVNDSFTRITGYAADQVVGRTAAEIGIWHRAEDRDRLLRALEQQTQVLDMDIDFAGRDGRVLPMRVSASRFTRDGQSYLVINARDMTDAGRARNEREAILANASVGIAFTRGGRFAMVNRHFATMYGWPADELIGQSGQVVWRDAQDYADVGREIGPALGRGEPIEIERLTYRRDRGQILARLRAKAIDPLQPIEGGTIWIALDVTAQRQAEHDLARARDQAEAANRAKSAFLANTSHEIRTPLNALVGLARLARQPGLAEGKRGLYLEQIAVSAEALSAIISDILDLSKIEAGRLDVESAPFDLIDLLQSLHQAYSALADSRGLTLDLELDPGVPMLARGDAMRVRQILANFLQNALKFTVSGGVRLVVRTVPGERVRFEVHDSGPGIDAATQARLFEPFTQADESTTRRFGGTGLGLSICRELAALMGGRVGMTSQPGRGSCFHAELPLPAHHEPLRHSAHGGLDDELLSGASVLLVEDNPVNMMIGVALLEQWGVAVTQAADGAEALAAVAQTSARGRPFQAVLMDVQMPGMSGYEVTQALRERYTKRQLPVIALTAAALVSERERAAAVGMNDFLTKPIDARRLRSALLDALEGGDASGAN